MICMFCLVSTVIFAQEYTEIVDVPGKTASKLYATAKEWFSLAFKSGKSVIDLDDPINGKLIGKGYTNVTASYSAPFINGNLLWEIDLTIEILVKDNKYKATILEINVTNNLQTNEYSINNNLMGRPLPKSVPVKFATFYASKEYYKNGSNLEWLLNKNEKDGKKVKKNFVKINCAMNGAWYSDICQTDDKMKSLLESLKLKMKKVEESW